MKCPFAIIKCTKCCRLLVAYSGNFTRNKTRKWGLNTHCKMCDKEYYKKTKEERLEYQEKYREEHKEELSEKRKKRYEENKEAELKRNKQYYEENKERISEQQRQYRENNKEIITERNKQYYEENKERIKKKSKQYYEENKERISEQKKQYKINNPHVQFNGHNKRRTLEESQGEGITKEQWFEMMCWFDWCCAYSGEYIGGDSELRTIDHIVPLSKGGEHEIWNCVPMTKTYNSSKYTNNMEEWYIQQEFYSEESLVKIYSWCEYAWNKWKPRRKGNRRVLI